MNPANLQRNRWQRLVAWVASRRAALVVVGLLMIHTVLLGYAASVLSPVYDEPAHLAAGLHHWKLGRFDWYRVNPPLVRAWATIGLQFREWDCAMPVGPENPASRPEFAGGKRFVDGDGVRSFTYMTWARWTCIPFSLLGGVICFLFARDLWGDRSGLIALSLWCFSPNILAHAVLITPDAHCAALGIAACYVFWRWLRRPNWWGAYLAGVVLGLCELTKFTWIVLFALWPILWLVYLRRRRQPQSQNSASRENVRSGLQLFFILSLAVYVINVGYGFEGSFPRLGKIPFVSQLLTGIDADQPRPDIGGNRFATNWIGAIPIPLPENYVRGIDVQRWDFERERWSYLGGQWKSGGWWYYYLYALAIKAPLGTWMLVVLALVRGLCCRGSSSRCRDELCLLLPAIVVLAIVSSQTGMNDHMRYVLPIFPFAFVWISKVGSPFEALGDKARGALERPESADDGDESDRIATARESSRQIVLRRMFAVLVVASLAWSMYSSLSVYPHSLCYFNELAGGPMNGHKHLTDSNIDWGQDLLFFKKWYDRHPEARPLHFAYVLNEPGLIDPAILAITYTLPPPGPQWKLLPPKTPEEQLGPHPGWHAASVFRMRYWDRKYEYLFNFEPVATAGYGIFIYHISLEEANHVRRKLGLRELTHEDVKR